MIVAYDKFKIIEENSNDDTVKQCLTVFKSVDFNPFFSVSIPELSRMNNQKGIFLWDLYGLVVNQYFKDREPDFEFHHNGNVYSSNTLNSELIYPKPNALELEIERFKSVEAMVEFQNSELMNIINTSPDTFVLKVENAKSKIANYLIDNDWPQNFGALSTDFEKSIKTTEHIFIKDLLDSKEKIIEIIKTNISNISYGNRMRISLYEEDFAEVINEVIDTLIYYNYTPEEIYLVINNITKQYYKVKEKEKGASFVDFIKCYKHYQNGIHDEEMLYIGMKDKLGVESYAYIPWEKIANKRLYLLDKLGNDKERLHSIIDYASESKNNGLYQNQSDSRRLENIVNRAGQTKNFTSISKPVYSAPFPDYLKEQMKNISQTKSSSEREITEEDEQAYNSMLEELNKR